MELNPPTNAKVGDIVVINYKNRWVKAKVEKVTKTQLVTDGGSRITKATGRVHGEGSDYWPCAAYEMTAEISNMMGEIRKQVILQQLRNKVPQLPFHLLGEEELKAIVKIFQDAS